jgi:hypothetical protein
MEYLSLVGSIKAYCKPARKGFEVALTNHGKPYVFGQRVQQIPKNVLFKNIPIREAIQKDRKTFSCRLIYSNFLSGEACASPFFSDTKNNKIECHHSLHLVFLFTKFSVEQSS